MSVTVVHTDRVNLFFVALDAVGRANVISEDPGLSSSARVSIDDATREERRADCCEISVDCVLLKVNLRGTRRLLLHSFRK